MEGGLPPLFHRYERTEHLLFTTLASEPSTTETVAFYALVAFGIGAYVLVRWFEGSGR